MLEATMIALPCLTRFYLGRSPTVRIRHCHIASWKQKALLPRRAQRDDFGTSRKLMWKLNFLL